MFTRFLLALVPIAFVTAVVAPGAAVADPKAGMIPSTCDDGHSIELALNGNGDFTPGHLVGGTAVYVVQALDADRTFTAPDGTVRPDPLHVAKPNMHGDLVRCHFDITATSPDGTVFHGVGVLTAFITPVS